MISAFLNIPFKQREQKIPGLERENLLVTHPPYLSPPPFMKGTGTLLNAFSMKDSALGMRKVWELQENEVNLQSQGKFTNFSRDFSFNRSSEL